MQLKRNEILTGLLVVATLAILTGVLILLGAPGLFRPLVTYRIYFDNAAGIKLGAPVLLAGRKIGTVADLFSPVSKEESHRAVEVDKAVRGPDATPTPPNAKPPRYEVRIDVQVDRRALLYRNSKPRMITLGLLGETAIDFTEGTEASGRAASGEVFAGERVPDFGEAIASLLDVVQPVATEATATLKQLESTAQNLSHITDENSQLNLALTQFRTLGENLNQLTGPNSPLSSSLGNLQKVTEDLNKNDNVEVTLQNLRVSSEKLKSTLDSVGPSLEDIAHNVKDATATLRSEPWRLVWPSTKKYPSDNVPALPAQTSTRTAKKSRPTPTPSRTSRR